MGGVLSSVLGTSNNYSYNAAPGDQAAAGAIANQGNTAAQQQALLSALQNQAAGNGPNPAQQMLNQQTQANNAQNAGFIASQKGINPAIATRLAAQNAASMNQQAAGQGATLGAQQQLAAQQQEQGVLAQQQQANLTQQGYAYGNNNAANQVNAGVAAANQQTNAGLVGGLLGGAATLGSAGILAGAANPASGAIGSLDGSSNLTMPTLGSSSGFAKGGQIPSKSKLHSFLDEMVNGKKPEQSTGDVGTKLKSGGHVPGTPKVAGNSYKNDTVKALLSPGEVVIPNSVMQSKDPISGAAKFVQAVMAKKKGGKNA